MLKQKLAETVLLDLEPFLAQHFQDPEAHSDSWMRFGLKTLRLHDLVKNDLCPALRSITQKEMERGLSAGTIPLLSVRS